MLKEGQNYETSGQLLLSLLLNGNHVTLRPSAPCHLIYGMELFVQYSSESTVQITTEEHDYVVYSAQEYAISGGCPVLAFTACDFLTKSISNNFGSLVF